MSKVKAECVGREALESICAMKLAVLTGRRRKPEGCSNTVLGAFHGYFRNCPLLSDGRQYG